MTVEWGRRRSWAAAGSAGHRVTPAPPPEAAARAIAAHSPDCLKLLDDHDRIVWINDRGCRLMGIPDPAAMIGVAWPSVWPPDTQPELAAALRTARDGGVGRFTGRCPTFAGVWKWWSVAVVAVTDTADAPRLLVISREVTDLITTLHGERAMAVEAGIAREEAERAKRSQNEILATVAHDLRAPLNAVLSWAALLQTADGDGAAAALGRRIETVATEQMQLLQRLLESHAVAGKQGATQFATLRLTRAASEVSETLRPLVDAKGLTVTMREDVEHADLIFGDPVSLRQAILNVFSNAVKFTPAGGEIVVTSRASVPHCTLTFQDNGIGIAPESIARILEPCVAEDGGVHHEGGFGLGLHIARRAIEPLAGSLHVRSAGIGRGTSVTLSFPVAQGSILARDGAARPCCSEQGPLSGLAILLVTTDVDGGDAVARVLKSLGARIARCDGSDDETVDGVIVDLDQTQGLNAADRLRERFEHRQAWWIALASELSAQARDSHLECFDAVLAKPVSAGTLADHILGLAPSSGR